jgi:hypothetical protein
MKRDTVSILLVTIFIATTATASWMCYWFLKASRDLRNVQAVMAYNDQRRAAIQSLAIDLGEYSKTHPAINPMLEQIGLRARQTTNSISGRP